MGAWLCGTFPGRIREEIEVGDHVLFTLFDPLP